MRVSGCLCNCCSCSVSYEQHRNYTNMSHVPILAGYYVFIETSSPRKQGDKARLVGPQFAQSSTKRCIQFWYHMYGRTTGSLRVLAKWGAGNKSEAILWSLSGSQGSQWKFGRVSFSRNSGAYRVCSIELKLSRCIGFLENYYSRHVLVRCYRRKPKLN